MANPNKRKGTRVEVEILNLHLKEGLPAKKVPSSGALGKNYYGEDYSADLRVLDELHAEVKSRKGGAGFKTLEGWLGENDLLFLRRDRAKPFVAMTWETYVHICKLILVDKETDANFRKLAEDFRAVPLEGTDAKCEQPAT